MTEIKKRDLSQFRKNTNVGIFKEEKLDLNGDNKADYVVYSSGGEETYLSVLLANTDGFAVWHFPTAENYKIERAGWGRFQVILEFSTFPAYGSLWGSDKYQWRDYYEITNNSVALVNHKYKQFFAGQQQLYKTRFLELNERQRQMEQTTTDDDLTYVELGRVKALIGRYEDWIKKAMPSSMRNESNFARADAWDSAPCSLLFPGPARNRKTFVG